jgi:hypothetical protein
VTCAALFIHFELDRDLSTASGSAEWNVETRLDILSALWARLPRLIACVVEYRSEQVTESSKPSDVEVLEVDVRIRSC